MSVVMPLRFVASHTPSPRMIATPNRNAQYASHPQSWNGNSRARYAAGRNPNSIERDHFERAPEWSETRERERADSEHREHDDRDTEERRDGRDLAVAEPRGFVDRDQPAEALVEVTAPPAVLVRSPLHVAGPVDAHDVEHRRPDVDDRDQSRMPRVRRDHQARAKPGRPQRGHRQPGGPAQRRRPDDHDGIARRIDACEEPTDEVVEVLEQRVVAARAARSRATEDR